MSLPRGKRRRRIKAVMQEWLRNPWLLLFPWVTVALAALGDVSLTHGQLCTCYIFTAMARGTLLMWAAMMLLPFLP